MSKPEFVYTTYIKTTPDRLWHALTDREFAQRYWMDCVLTSDWKVGSRMTMERYGELKNECRILESDPPRKLSYSWLSVFDPDMKKELPSQVTYLIEQHDEIVKFTLIHKGFAEGSKTLSSVAFGWPIVLAGLKSILETGEPLKLSPEALAQTETIHEQA
jgi:uncharacterized protein YndB with AHSA1/START domain